MSPIVEVKDFSFKYRDTKRRAVKHVDFQVEEGSFFTIIGANGAGKSTLCNALVGLIPHYFVGPGAGHILIDGTDVADSTIAELSKTIGLVFQNPFNQLSYTAGTVAEELAYGLGNHGVPRSADDRPRRSCGEIDAHRPHSRQEPAGTVGWTGAACGFRIHFHHGTAHSGA